MPEEFEGYCVGDVTYSVDPLTNQFFPVRVTKIGRRFLDVEPLDVALADVVSPEFKTDKANQRFMRPKLPGWSRFGGCDGRTVNADRVSGQELRLLPYYYGTYTNDEIKKRHDLDPILWPLPTGTVYERWFKER